MDRLCKVLCETSLNLVLSGLERGPQSSSEGGSLCASSCLTRAAQQCSCHPPPPPSLTLPGNGMASNNSNVQVPLQGAGSPPTASAGSHFISSCTLLTSTAGHL